MKEKRGECYIASGSLLLRLALAADDEAPPTLLSAAATRRLERSRPVDEALALLKLDHQEARVGAEPLEAIDVLFDEPLGLIDLDGVRKRAPHLECERASRWSWRDGLGRLRRLSRRRHAKSELLIAQFKLAVTLEAAKPGTSRQLHDERHRPRGLPPPRTH